MDMLGQRIEVLRDRAEPQDLANVAKCGDLGASNWTYKLVTVAELEEEDELLARRDTWQAQSLTKFGIEDSLEELWTHRLSLRIGQHLFHPHVEDTGTLAIFSDLSFKETEKHQ